MNISDENRIKSSKDSQHWIVKFIQFQTFSTHFLGVLIV